jgi:hypothetical protein
LAGGVSSLAAGFRAKVRDDDEGTFVWADRTDHTGAYFTSSGPNQFLIRAGGGVGIGTNSPNGQLSVQGDADFTGNVGIGTTAPTSPLTVAGQIESTADGFRFPDGTIQSTAATADSHSLDAVDGDPVNAVFVGATGNVGFNTSNPQVELDIASLDTVGTITVQPSSAGDVTELVLAEDINADFAMITRYDGVANQLHFIARQSGVETAPLVSINRSSAGNVGIGTTSPAAGFKLDVIGDIRCTSLTQTSSRSLKENIAPIEGALDKVGRLQGVQFNWTAEHGGRADLGFVAEDVAEVLPELVTWDEPRTKAAGLKYGHLTAVAVEAIKELRAEKNAEIEALRAENADLTTRLERLEELLARNLNSKEVSK